MLNDCSRGDTQDYADLDKLAKRFLKGGNGAAEGEEKVLPSRAYIQEVVEELKRESRESVQYVLKPLKMQF